MKQHDHYIQDACEFYVVAQMQKFAEQNDFAKSKQADRKFQEYEDYLRARKLNHNKIQDSEYVANCDAIIPEFLSSIKKLYPHEKMDFENIEKEARDQNLKGDFEINFIVQPPVKFSLKNYKGGIRRMQFKSGTFNSFVLNFLFTPAGVGTFQYIDADGTIKKFRGNDRKERDSAIASVGYSEIISLVHDMDSIHENMRATVLDSGNFAFYDEHRFDALRKEVGLSGVKIALKILNKIDRKVVHDQIIDMTGFDGAEELLAVSKHEYLDSFTNQKFHKFREILLHEETELTYNVRGQSLLFDFKNNQKSVMRVDVPFTINSNGAWYRDEPFEGTRYHQKEKMLLSYGQLRPKKSREIATSINTYVDLGSTSIYSEDEI